MKNLCFVATDAVSFNLLCAGQLEFLVSRGDVRLTLVCGGAPSEIRKLKGRGVGCVVDVGLVRQPCLVEDIKALWLLVEIFRKNRFDVVMYSTPKALLLGAVASRMANVRRRVALVRGRAYENFSGLRRKVYQFFDWLALRFSHDVVFISHSLMQAYESDKVYPGGGGVVLGSGSSNGVNTEEFAPHRCRNSWIEARAALDLQPSDFVIVIVGRFCADKGAADLESVISVLGRDPGIKFLLIGWHEDEVGRQCVERAKAMGAVFVEDPAGGSAPFFRIADLHLFLSHREGFGNVALEAASCGVPTVGYDVVGVQDSIAVGISGQRFERGDVKGVVDFIADANRDPINFKNRFSEARLWACRLYEQEMVWDGYSEFLLQND